MEQVLVRILIDEDGRGAALDGLAASSGDCRVRVCVESRLPAPNVVPDPEDPWDRWPDHLFID